MAYAPSALFLPLHPNILLLAHRRRRFLRKARKQRLKRGVFHSIVDLQATINRFLEHTNNDPQPFIWTKDPDKIIAAVRRGHQALDSIH